MKKDIKILAIIYIGIFLFAHVLSFRMEKLETQEDSIIHKKSVVIKINENKN